MFSNKVVKSSIIAATLALGALAQPAFAGSEQGADQGAAQAASQRAWVEYWLGFLDTLDRKFWAQAG